MGTTYGAELVARYTEMWTAGTPTVEIAAQLGLSGNAVTALRPRLNLPPRDPARRRDHGFEAVHAARLAGQDWASIARDRPVRSGRLRGWYAAECKRLGVTPAAGLAFGGSAVARGLNGRRPTEVDYGEAHRMRAQGAAWHVIAATLHTYRGSLQDRYRAWCVAEGVAPADPARVAPLRLRVVEAEPAPEPIPGGVEYTAEMSREVCQFPLSQSGLRWWFCGCATVRGPWCAGHRRVVWERRA